MHDYFLRLIKGAYMAKGLGDLMKQMQAMQAKMEQMQEELAEKRVEGSAGGRMMREKAEALPFCRNGR